MDINISNLTTTILNFVLALILSSAAVSAQPPWARGGGPDGFGGGMIEERSARLLNLTDAQKTQIKALREQAQAASQPYLEQLKPLTEEMHKLTEAPVFDETTARTLVVKMSQLQSELHLIRAKTQTAIHQLLTPEQKAQLAERRKAMQDRQGSPLNGGGGRRGGSGRLGN